MKPRLLFLLLLFPLFLFAQKDLQLRYTSPAKVWEASLPLGNGRIGMMPDGGIDTEKIALNDITMWSGSPEDALNADAINYLPEIRRLLLAGKNLEAQQMMYEHFRCKGQGSAFGAGKDAPYGCFQMLGNLNINYQYPDVKTRTQNYNYSLSLSDAIARTSFQRGNIRFSREYLVSHADDVMIIRISADKRKSVAFNLELTRPERAVVSVKNNTLCMEGQLNDGYNTDKGVRYVTQVKIVNKGGKVASQSNSLALTGADEALIIISSSTDMLDKNYKNTVEKMLLSALNSNYNSLKNNHIKKYQQKFNRVELNLGKQNHTITTDERVKRFQEDEDPALAALYFQFGRYLMMCGTRENTLPLNLQGLWANTLQTPWNGDYHLNINVQMNYWLAEVGNLSELHQPLIDFTQSLVPSGKATAKTFYNADGWVAHVITNPWLFTAPAEHASWGATNTGGAWLCEHLWEHYAFTLDKEYLRAIYPTLKAAADFFLTNMIEEPSHGWLVTAPSSSPENAFYLPESKEPVYVCMGPTMDVQIIRELFGNVLQASKILCMEDKTVQGIRRAMPKLPPIQISPEGYLQEWLQDYKEVEPHHRHVSHLYGLYPANQISPYQTPALAKAAQETLNRRGDGGTGWSRAWKVNFWARLHDGNRAHKLLKSLMQPAYITKDSLGRSGGTYPNMFCAHPPFQIDGNFGGAAGIAEMLIQSQDGYIQLLPALPDNWATGSFKGLRVRGGAEVDVYWKDKCVKEVVITASTDNELKLKMPESVSFVSCNGKTIFPTKGFMVLKMKKGEKQTLKFSKR